MHGFFAWMTEMLKSHFTKQFRTKFGEVDAQTFCATCEAAICWQLFTMHFLLNFAEIGPSGSLDLNTFCSFYLVKNTKLLITWQPLKLKKKYTKICDPYNFSNLLIFVWPNLLKNQILHYKISYWQPSYLLGEISSL